MDAAASNQLDNLLLVKLDATPNALIDYLCRKFEIQAIQVKTINEHYFKQQIIKLYKKNIFLQQSDLKEFNSNDLGLTSLIKFNKPNELKYALEKLNYEYENLLNATNSGDKETCSVLNCLDLIYSFDIDERLFLNDKRQQCGDVDSDEDVPDEFEAMDIEENDSNSFKIKIKPPVCLGNLERAASEHIHIEHVNFIQKFIEENASSLIRNSIHSDLKVI